MKNIFITLEGIEGSGKSSVAKYLERYFISRGFAVYRTSEPDKNSPFSMDIKDIVMKYDNLSPITESLLFAAARHEHCVKIMNWLIENLDRDCIVISDRYILSSLVYQSEYLNGIHEVLGINQKAHALNPDKCYVLDVDPKISLVRIQSRDDNNRFDDMNLEYHEDVRNRYLMYCQQYGKDNQLTSTIEQYNLSLGDIIQIDASRSIPEISKDIIVDVFNSMGKPIVQSGDRVEIISLGNYEPLYHPGDKGIVNFVDDAGSIHVHWDSGGSISLLPECDCWKKI